jgi:hypothetical protein
MATVRQMAQVITAEDANGRSYVRRAMNKLAELGLAETNGKDGRHPIWNLTPVGQMALADGNELPPRSKAGAGATPAPEPSRGCTLFWRERRSIC